MKSAKFKDSPLGPIPRDWEVKRLGDLCSITTGHKDVNEGSELGLYPFFTCSRNVYRANSYSFDGEAILIAGNGEVGNLHYYDGKFEAYQRTYVLMDFSVNVAFLRQYLSAFLMRELMDDKTGSSMPYIVLSALSNCPIPYPSEDEQQRIAEALGEVDKLIESLDEQIEKKRLIAKGVAHDLLGMRNDKNEPIRRIPGFKEEWEKKDYKDVFLHHKGKSIGTSEYESSGQFPVIDQGQESVVAYSDNIDALFHVPDGGAIVFGDHTRIVKYVSKDFIVGADGTQILSGLGCDTQFLYHALRQIEIPNLGYNRHFKFIKNYQYSLPPTLAEQQAIADLLGEQDAAIAALEAKREKYTCIKEGMMHDLLTGKVRMKGE